MSPAAARQKYVALAVLLGPSLVGMAVFLMLPVASSFVLSFSSWDLIGEINWIGLDNYTKALSDPAVLGALRNTLTFILGYLPATVGIALGLALLLNRPLRGDAPLTYRGRDAIWTREIPANSTVTFRLRQ